MERINIKPIYIFIAFMLVSLLACKKHEVNIRQSINYDFTDYSGKQYQTIKIGNDIWMAENLAYLPKVFKQYNSSNTEPRTYVYDFDDINLYDAHKNNNYQNFGALYNYIAAINYCPKGWHLPSENDWRNLEIYCGMDNDIIENTNYRGAEYISISLRSSSYWIANNGNNLYKFNVLPSGLKDSEGFKYLYEIATFWTSTNAKVNTKWIREFSYSQPGIARKTSNPLNALSVRYIKDK